MIRSNLKEILDRENISIRQLAADIDYRFETVRKLYNNELERYPKELLYKVCIYLHITTCELLIIE